MNQGKGIKKEENILRHFKFLNFLFSVSSERKGLEESGERKSKITLTNTMT